MTHNDGIHEVEYNRDVEGDNKAWWASLLVIPLFLLLGMGMLGAYRNYTDTNNDSAAVNTQDTTGRSTVDDNTNGTQFGVGGAPNISPTLTVSPTRTPTPSVSPSPTTTDDEDSAGAMIDTDEEDMDDEDTTELGEGGGGTPQKPPASGMGGMAK